MQPKNEYLRLGPYVPTRGVCPSCAACMICPRINRINCLATTSHHTLIPFPIRAHHPRLLCVRAGLMPWPPQSAIVKALRRDSVQQDLLALNDLARIGLLSEGEIEWDDIEDSMGGTGGALVLGWASRRRLKRESYRRRQARTEADELPG